MRDKTRNLVGCSVGYLGAVAAVLLLSPAKAEERTVNFYNWSNYMAPGVLEDFTKETGIKVVYDTFDANETLETRLLAGKSGYDVVVPTGYFLQRQITAKVFLKLDKSKLPNLVNAWPVVTGQLATYDPGNVYAANYMWGTTGIGYNVKMAQKVLGADAKIDSWDIVFKPENLAKFGDCGIHMLDSADDILPAALGYLGLAISVFPYLVPPSITIWDAAAAPASQIFMLLGTLPLLPIILIYTGFVYYVFRGKVKEGEGYH